MSRVARSVRNYLTSRGLILLYHRIAEVRSDPWSLSVTPAHFAEQLEVLRKFGRPMRLRDFTHSLHARHYLYRPLVVTFDDGYADNLYHAKPLLEHYEIPATVFLTTGYLGQDREFWWDALERLLLQAGRLPRTLSVSISGHTYRWELKKAVAGQNSGPPVDRRWRAWDKCDPSPRHALYRSLYQLLHSLPAGDRQQVLDDLQTWAGISPLKHPTCRPLTLRETATVVEGGLIEVGSHTVTHPVLSACPAAAQREEIRQSKARLEEVVGGPVTSFAYPYGRQSDYTAETVALVREAGYACACSASANFVRRGTDPHQLPRVHVEDWDGERFAKRLSQWFGE